MKVQLDVLKIARFKSFTDEQQLDLAGRPVGLHFLRGRNLVDKRLGSNGSGKTSIWDALCWCLYGKTPSGLRNPDIEPWAGRHSSNVSLSLLVDGKRHTITRGTHPNRFLIDDKEADTASGTFDLIGMDYSLFTNTILLGQGQPLFFDLTPKDKLSLFTEVLRLDRWDERSAKAADKTRKYETQIGEYQSAIDAQTQVLAEIDELLKSARKAADDWEGARQKQITESANIIKALTKQYDGLLALKESADLDFDGAGTELKACKRTVTEALDRVKDAERAVDRAEYERKQVKDRIDKLADSIKGLAKGDNCPVCLQPLSGTALDKHRKDVQREIESLTIEWKKPLATKLNVELTAAKHRLGILRDQEQKFSDKADKARNTLDRLIPEVADLKAQLDTALRAKNRSEDENNPYEAQIKTLNVRKTKVKTALTEDRQDLKTVTELAERTRFWVKGFKDIRLFVIDEVLQELELTANSMLEEVGLIGWHVQFDIEKETKSGSIQRGLIVTIQSSVHKEPVRWESWSGGEGQRLRLIGALALSEVLLNYAGVEPDFEALDEPTRHLSGAGISDLCDFLAERAKTLKRRTWYTDHRVTESSRFASTVTVTRDKQGSTIE
jgi:DNA repair exonuclease SbcCD ATPase subunit